MRKLISVCLMIILTSHLYIYGSVKNLPKNLYDENFYDNTPHSNWKFFDKKYCDVKLDLNFEKMLSVPSHFVYEHKTGELQSSILYLWNNPEYNKKIANSLYEFNFKFRNDALLKSAKKDYTDGVIANVQVLHYLGLKNDDFKKLRWFFSAEDFAFYPEKIYRFLHVLDRVSKKFDEKKWFRERHSVGIPIICYWYDGGTVRSRWSNFYSTTQKNFRQNERRWWKIIYLKTG